VGLRKNNEGTISPRPIEEKLEPITESPQKIHRTQTEGMATKNALRGSRLKKQDRIRLKFQGPGIRYLREDRSGKKRQERESNRAVG